MAPLTEDVQSLVEEVPGFVVPVLLECEGMMGAYGEHREKTFDERIRECCAMARMAVLDEAAKRSRDASPGAITRKTNWQTDDGPWTKADDLLKSRINAAMLKALVPEVQAIFDDYLTTYEAKYPNG